MPRFYILALFKLWNDQLTEAKKVEIELKRLMEEIPDIKKDKLKQTRNNYYHVIKKAK